MNLACFEIARAVLEQPAKIAGSELYFHCPRHDDRSPSLQINTAKDCWACFPCNASGNAWQLAAWLAGCAPDDRETVKAWLRKHGLLNGNSGDKRIVGDLTGTFCTKWKEREST